MKKTLKKTLIIGASENLERYSNKAIRKLRESDYEVVAIGAKKGKVMDVEFSPEKIPFKDIDTISLYINPKIQKEYYKYILSLHPKRIIFNPGTENEELSKLAGKQGVISENACTLVLLSTQQY